MRTEVMLSAVCVLGLALNAADVPVLSDAEQEKFLRTAKIVSSADIGRGVTKPIKAELSDGKLKHSASIQRVNKELSDFFGADGTRVPMIDAWRFNIAVYKIDRLLNLNVVPVAVSRPFEGRPGGFSWWVDNILMDEADRLKNDVKPPDEEAFKRQMETLRVFDELIINIDRNYANILITKDWKINLIDHSRTMTAYPKIRNEANLTRCSRKLLAAMKSLKEEEVAAATGTFLKPAEVKALIARRDRIVEFFEKKAREKGESEAYIP